MNYLDPKELLARAEAEGWRRAFFVTALELELRAVLSHIELIGTVYAGGATFECGTFADKGVTWLIVACETGAGTHPALSVVTDGHRLFKPFEVQILVGIGGSRKKSAKLGSVVAARAVYLAGSGKYQDGHFYSRPRTFEIDRGLVALAKKVALDGAWRLRVQDPQGETLVSLEEAEISAPPRGHVQAICSIEAVQADPDSELEKAIELDLNDTYVVEMEGYGAVYAAFRERTPSMVVRGVSDLTKEKTEERDEILQPIAAAHAAAFGFELLTHWAEVEAAPVLRLGLEKGTTLHWASRTRPRATQRFDRNGNRRRAADCGGGFRRRRCA